MDAARPSRRRHFILELHHGYPCHLTLRPQPEDPFWHPWRPSFRLILHVSQQSSASENPSGEKTGIFGFGRIPVIFLCLSAAARCPAMLQITEHIHPQQGNAMSCLRTAPLTAMLTDQQGPEIGNRISALLLSAAVSWGVLTLKTFLWKLKSREPNLKQLFSNGQS
jgi:hypothetical protein